MKIMVYCCHEENERRHDDSGKNGQGSDGEEDDVRDGGVVHGLRRDAQGDVRRSHQTGR